MALSCLLSRVSLANCIARGQTLRAVKNLAIRSSTTLSNNDLHSFFKSDGSKNKLLLSRVTSPAMSSRMPLFARYSTCSDEDEAPHKSHNHVTIWKLERVLAAVLLPAIPAALYMPSQALDTAVAILIVMHTHWGLEAIVVDYIRPILFGDLAPKIGLGLLYIFSIAMLAGLLNLIYNDYGLANAILQIWKS